MGPYLIIFGTRGVTYNAQQGEFHCPRCGKHSYRQRRVRRFFTLYFVPLIPLDLLGEYVECNGCKDTYRLEVLELDPEGDAAELEAEFQIAIRRTMVLMCLADGVVDDEEVRVIAEVYGELAGRDIDEPAIRNEIEAARAEGSDILDYLGSVVGMLNDSGRELVVRASLMVAAADGEFQDEERDLLAKIAKALEMSPAHLNGVIASFLPAEDEDVGASAAS